jgi:hypothetical protein
MSQPSEYPDEVVRLLNIDARKLGELAVEHPDLAMECVELMDDYKQLANDVQERTDGRHQALVSGSTQLTRGGTAWPAASRASSY